MGFGFISRTNTYGARGLPLKIAVTVTSTMGFSLFGYDQGLMSGIITGEQFNDEFPPTKANGLTDRYASTIQGAVTACYELGCFFGALLVLFVGDRLGRKPLIIMGSFTIIVGTVISVTSFHPHWGLGQFVVGRVITGIGNGLNTATIPVWQSEMSKPENRGRLVNLEGSVVAVGTFVAYWIDFGMSYVNNSSQWRFPVAFQIFFAAIVFINILNLPESPRWLVGHNRKPEAVVILSALNDLPPDDDAIVAEMSFISDAANRFSRSQVGYGDLFTGGKSQHFSRMLIGSSSQFFQQFTGCNAAIYYSTVLFERMRLQEQNPKLPLILGGVFSTVYALFTLPSFFLVDTLGRRNLFLIGATGQACSMIISFACLLKQSIVGDDTTLTYYKGGATGLFLFIAFFSFTILPMPWIYPPEINPMRTRTAAAAISTCSNWLANFAVVMFTPVFIISTDWGCYLFFALVNLIFIPIIFFFYPETAGRSLEEMDIIFAKAHVERRFPFRVASTLPKMSLAEIEQQGNELGLFDEDFEKENFENQEVLSSSSYSKKEESDGGLFTTNNENAEKPENNA